jgi:transcriptional regulator with XRE-family HTH domain
MVFVMLGFLFMDEDIQRLFYIALGSNIRSARERKGLTQEALASLVSMTRTSITNLEKGRQRFLVHTFAQISKALECKPDDLMPKILTPEMEEENSLDSILDSEFESKEANWIRGALKNNGD